MTTEKPFLLLLTFVVWFHPAGSSAQENTLQPQFEILYDSLKTAYDNYDFTTCIALEPEILPLARIRNDTLKANVLSFLGDSFLGVGDYEKSLGLYQQELHFRESILGPDFPDREILLENMAVGHLGLGNHSEAERLYQESLSILQEVYGKNSKEYVETTAALGEIYISTYDFKKLDKLYRQLEKSLGKNSIYYSKILNGKANSKALQGHFSESEQLYLQALEKIEKEGDGKYSHDYVGNLNGLGTLYIDMGRLPEAELILSDALNILDLSGDDETPDYPTILNNLAVVYEGLGFYEQSAELFSEIIGQDKELYGEEHPMYTIPLGNQASVLVKMGKYDQAEKNYDQALKIFQQIGDTQNSDYAILLKEKALLYQKIGKQQEALGLLQKAVGLQKEILGEDHPEYAKALFNLGNHYLSMGNEDSAGALLERSMEIRKELLGENHPDFAQSLRKMAIYHWKKGNYKEAYQLFLQTFANYFNQIEAFFPTLSEAEKAKFYNTKLKVTFEEFISYAVVRSRSNPNLIDQMYNYQLATKALIMYATNKVRENILTSGDKKLIEKYNQWIAQKEELSKLFSLSLDELNQRDRDLNELQQASNQLEKELGAAFLGLRPHL